MRYSHRFSVNTPANDVAAFHRHTDAFKAISPPLIVMRLHSPEGSLSDGDTMAFTMWLGPVPIYWEAAITHLPDGGFIDRQVAGPFGRWQHSHTFVERPDGTTEVRDDIEAEYGGNLWDRLRAFVMWSGLPLLFAYRGWRTRRLLNRSG